MRYLIGMDGGGTRCRIMAAGENGVMLGRAEGGSTSVESNPPETVRSNIESLLRALASESGLRLKDCAALCLGTAGVDSEESLLRTEEILKSLALPFPFMVVNDGQIALAAQTGGGPGILIISGTGSIGVAADGRGNGCRAGGYGHLVGDEGSGYWAASQAVRALLLSNDGLSPETMLTHLVFQALGVKSVEQVLDFVYHNNKSELAKLSCQVETARRLGDQAAVDIMNRAADYLAALAAVLARRLPTEGKTYPLFLAGGFLTHTPWLREAVTQRALKAYPALAPGKLQREAEWGAVFLAARKAGIKGFRPA